MERPAAPSSACLFSYLVSAFARISTLTFNLIFNVHSNTPPSKHELRLLRNPNADQPQHALQT
ncbi:hypothetical protein PF005_g6804 [Phytophthora fragariae]|uniref:Uncharacterized protein n=2 Tax=Phytophthora TaxID=4783 RepID=A0A6A3SUX1_9STRA|nr:hypothetical protein PF003_g13093 [Phytophthora fragariae]KAE9026917.1 hypothetical protein PR002_g10795 [Phytophthora rubi]KAE8942951.1 hypothetical protein PF009_g7313 [Phytophthora fragariae]KAE9021455.1 hypothetical protein PF011_g4937 [Phytophthora fragariae]KAE9124040.1 hypothetical protein PF007_g6853 [Phytophthora fragariae]